MTDQPTLRVVQPEDLFRLKFLQGARLSPDGAWIAYGLTDVDKAKDEETVSIWLLSLETGDSHRLTSGTARDTNPQWSPDGTQISFLSTRGGVPQVYVIPVSGGEPAR